MVSRLIASSERSGVLVLWLDAHSRNKRTRSCELSPLPFRTQFLSGRLTPANTHLPKRRVLALAPESWKLLLAQLQACMGKSLTFEIAFVSGFWAMIRSPDLRIAGSTLGYFFTISPALLRVVSYVALKALERIWITGCSLIL